MTVNNGDNLKVTMEVTLADGTIAQNVYYLHAELLAQQADLTVVNAIESWIESAYNELSADLVSTITQNLCTVQEIDWNAVKAVWEVVRLVGYFTPTITYGNAGEALPNMTSAFATFATLRPKSRGRKFLFPFGEDRQAGTYLIGAALADMADYATIILNSITLSPLNLLWSGVPRSGVNEFLWPLYVGTVTDLLGTQRRRRPGVGA